MNSQLIEPTADLTTAHERPKLTAEQQIEHLKSKGVKFEKCSEEEALGYLRENNNYFKLRAYRTGFEKIENGDNAGKYIDLDFAMLRDVAIIDMEMRYNILPLALDIEHSEKVKLLRYVSESNEDGYSVISEYMNFLQEQEELGKNTAYSSLKSEIARNQQNSYCSGIVQKYQNNFPIWAFLEVITFGSLIHFLRFCLSYFEDKAFTKMFENDYYLLRSIKTIRNAAAHSNCILNQLQRNTSKHPTDYELNRELSKLVSKSQRDRLMSSAAVQDFVTLLFVHQKIVSSTGVRKHRGAALKQLTDRMCYHADYYANNPVISTSFDFFKKTVDKFFEV
ncbi:MAG: Abi family protein [Clostridia bacterium]|nr:Abi family protein [Clostridia bacterium]